MRGPLSEKNIVLGVTGSIACYKGIDLASKLTQSGAFVEVIMTKSSMRFISPLSFKSITHRDVVTDIFDPKSKQAVSHVMLAENADAVVVAPATANSIAKIAYGLSDDALGTTILATKSPVIVAPAMDGNMFNNPATQENIAKLISRGIFVAGPAEGRLASGLAGYGRLVEVSDLIEVLSMTIGREGDLKDKNFVVSAGGTQESIDPVRTICNRSSGKMGYAVAQAARDRGAIVTLVTGPTSLPNPVGIRTIKVEDALQMGEVITRECHSADALVMAAAVADWRPVQVSTTKMKKNDSANWSIDLIRNPDILEGIKEGNIIKVGFAAETENLIENGKSKVKSKGLDFIVANDITKPDSGFSVDTNKVVIIHSNGTVEKLPLMQKYEVGNAILDRVKTGFGS